MNNNPLVSVAICIPTFNQAAYLGLAVESALQQGEEIEVWVSDDCSTDATPKVMETFRGDPRVRYVRHHQNRGISANADWVLRQPKTEFIARLDSDDLLLRGYIQTLSAALIENLKAGGAHCAIQEIDPGGNRTRLRLLRRASGFQDSEMALRQAVDGYRVAANICLFRKEALDGQSEIYRSGHNFAEDWDLWIRLADRGWGNVYCSQVLASYRVWTDANGVRPKRKLAEVEGCRRVFEESIAPAFRRRGWPEEELRRRREVLAAGHAIALAESELFSVEERLELVTALRRLGNGPALRRSLWLIRGGFGPVWKAWARAKGNARDFAKGLIATLRKARS